MCKKEITFQFFKDNPQVLYEINENENYKLFGIKPSTYERYLIEYRSIHEANRSVKIDQVTSDLYFKNKIRKKIVFDDSKLFGY